MKKYLILILVVSGVIHLSSHHERSGWQHLFNGQDLSNWDMYLGSSLGADFDEIAAAATKEGVFSVVDQDGTHVIRISGEINGSLATRESFENYHLRMVFRWGDKVYSRRNSGLLYHSFGEFGEAFGTWMPNIELQMMHQNLGDTYLMANTSVTTPVVKNENTNQFHFVPDAEKLVFGEHANGRLIRKASDAENPLGEWNTVDLYCYGTTAVHVVNGKTVKVNHNTGAYNDGVVLPLSAGKIQIQSEGAELFVKSVNIRSIDALPDDIMP